MAMSRLKPSGRIGDIKILTDYINRWLSDFQRAFYVVTLPRYTQVLSLLMLASTVWKNQP